MDNKEIAQLFREVAAAYTIKEVNRFRILAYERAADSIEHLSEDLKDLWKEGKLEEVPGIGSQIASHIAELFTKNHSTHLDEAKKGLPKAMFQLLKLPGFGAKKSYKLAKILDISDKTDAFSTLEKAAMAHKIAQIEGFGEKSEKEILTSIEAFRQKEAKLTRLLLPEADMIAQKVIVYLQKIKEVRDAKPLGSLRRMRDTVGDIDIAVASNYPEKVINHFVNYPDVKKVNEKGDKTASIILKNNAQVDMMVQPPEGFGALLQHFTGSKEHNIKLREYALSRGMSLSEYGIKKVDSQKFPPKADPPRAEKIYQYKDEVSFYNAMGLSLIPPELRENRGEIEASLHNQLPKLVELKDIRGDLHVHSSYDLEPSHDLGQSSFEELLDKANTLGYEYLGFSEHNPSMANHSNKDIIDIMRRRKQIIDNLKYSTKFTRVNYFIIMEIDILPDGQLALPDEAFNYLDAAIVAIHSSFNLNSEKMTRRLLTALSHPKVRILGHPTCRLLEKRDGIDADWPKVFNYCKEKDIALEVNANPYRLDLPDSLIFEAQKTGNKFIINTDAHQASEMDLMNYGVATARRGWAQKSDILNTLEYNEFRKWLTGK